MGRFLLMMKRWWILAMVVTLALSLTSCSKRRMISQVGNYGYLSCQGTMGSFDVYLFPPDGTHPNYEISLIPVQAAADGDVAQITLVNQQNFAFRQVVPGVVINTQQEIVVPSLSASDVQNFDVVAITSFDQTGQSFLEQTPEKASYCQIPPPDGGVTQATPGPGTGQGY